jgi:hypothetical protein
MAEPDFVDEMIAKLSVDDPGFPKLVERARRRRELLAALADLRKRQDLSDAAMADAMGTDAASVEDLETEAPDVRLSIIDGYADALGYVVQYHLVPAAAAAGQAPVVVH